MVEIELSQTPSQRFAINANEHNFDLTLRDIGGSMLLDVTVDGDNVVHGLPVLPNQPLIPYDYMAKYGNFILLTDSDNYPTWETIGHGSSFFYMSPEDIQEIANA